MSKSYKRSFIATMILVAALFATVSSLVAAPNKTEDQLIQMLNSQNGREVIAALEKLPELYPKSTNALSAVKEILKSKEVVVIRGDEGDKRTPAVTQMKIVTRAVGTRPNTLARQAARTLGDCHAAVGPDELKVIYELLRSREPDVVLDALKALRGLNAPDAVAELLPLLKDENHHVLRDTCRTLAVIGNKDNIPAIEPLLKNLRWDVKIDARDAIAALKAKP